MCICSILYVNMCSMLVSIVTVKHACILYVHNVHINIVTYLLCCMCLCRSMCTNSSSCNNGLFGACQYYIIIQLYNIIIL